MGEHGIEFSCSVVPVDGAVHVVHHVEEVVECVDAVFFDDEFVFVKFEFFEESVELDDGGDAGEVGVAAEVVESVRVEGECFCDDEFL